MNMNAMRAIFRSSLVASYVTRYRENRFERDFGYESSEMKNEHRSSNDASNLPLPLDPTWPFLRLINGPRE